MRASRPDRPRIALAAAGLLTLLVTGCGGDPPNTSGLSPEARAGLEIAQRAGCASCHGSDFTGGVAGPLVGLAGTTVRLADGTTRVADTEYLAESIADPDVAIVAGAETRMPDNELTADEIAQIVTYIEAAG